MATGDEEARKRRAEELRKEISKIESGEEPQDDSGEDEPESPRDFVERRMREEEAREKEGKE